MAEELEPVRKELVAPIMYASRRRPRQRRKHPLVIISDDEEEGVAVDVAVEEGAFVVEAPPAVEQNAITAEVPPQMIR